MRGAFQHAGGTVAYWDTDSLFVVATPTGGEVFPFAGGTETTEDGRPGVKALSYAHVHDLRWKIEVLSPYPAELRPHTYQWVDNIPYRVELPGLLKWEPENEPPPDGWGLPVEGPFLDVNRSKSYRTYHIIRPGPHVEIHDGKGVVVPPSREDLKQSRVRVTNPSMAGITFLPPPGAPDNYAEVLMEDLLAEYHQFDHSSEELAWRHEPGLSAVPGTRVEMIDTHPDNRPHSKIIIGRGLLGGNLVSAHPGGTWYDPEAGTQVTFNMDGPAPFDYHTLRTLDFEFRRTLSAPPSNALTVDGETPGRNTFGILRPAPTIVTSIQYIGRESRPRRDGRPRARTSGPLARCVARPGSHPDSADQRRTDRSPSGRGLHVS